MATPRLVGYAGLAAASLLGAVVLARPELVALAVPFAAVLALGVAAGTPPEVAVTFRTTPRRVVEGDEVEVTVEVSAAAPVERLELALTLPDGLDPADGPPTRTVRLSPGEPATLVVRVRPTRWGVFRPERCTVRASDRAGLVVRRGEYGSDRVLEVHPSTPRLRRFLRPALMQPFAGTHVSRARADGIEFADVRPFVAGDRVRSVNWRASARRGELWINDRHPERNTDVVLFLDTFLDIGRPGEGTLDRAVQAAAALAARHLAAADRVGLVGFGGAIRSIPAGMGIGQLRLIASALVSSAVYFSWADKGFDVLPPRSLPPRALVVALTPLADPRAVATLADIRARGFDVAVLECEPPVAAPAAGDRGGALARRLWDLERAALRQRFRAAGVTLATWAGEQPLAEALEEMDRLRRVPRPVHR